MNRGFTFIELLIAVSLMAIVGVVAFVNLNGRKLDTDVVTTAQRIATLLREAQSDSVAQEGGVSWGVYFANPTNTPPFYALFSGSSYATGTIVGQYSLPATVGYQTSTLPTGATLNIVFSQLSGTASASTSIGLYMLNGASFSSTISVASTGAVSY